MGVPGDDRHLLFHWANRVIGFQDPEYARYDEGRPIDPRSRGALADMFDYAHALAVEKRRRPGEDILTMLLLGDADGEKVSDEEFENFFFLLAVAGNETLRNAIPGGMLALIEQFPASANGCLPTGRSCRVRSRRCCGSWSPVMCFRRTATADTELHGVRIRAGDKVVVYYASANHDESVFPEPGKFDAARSPNDHLSFGIGPHFCLGAFLGRLEMRVSSKSFSGGSPTSSSTAGSSVCRINFQSGIKHMPVRFTPQADAR